MSDQLPLLIITGPTACGKTEVSIRLAQKINGEIISADSMQVYKYMNIGTAKPDLSQRGGVPHHLIDVAYPDEEFSVALFQKLAKLSLDIIYKKGKIPIVAGGTGFYINALLYDTDFQSAPVDEIYRKELFALAQERGNVYLHQQLAVVDPKSAASIHFNNVKRVVRALEFYHSTGQPIYRHNRIEKEKKINFAAAFFVLNRDRETLYQRINHRVDEMLENGLPEEVAWLWERGYDENLVSMQGLGYREILKYVKGGWRLEEAAEIMKKNTRHYAKRQLTWFRGQCPGTWLNIDGGDYKKIVSTIRKELSK